MSGPYDNPPAFNTGKHPNLEWEGLPILGAGRDRRKMAWAWRAVVIATGLFWSFVGWMLLG